MDVKKFRTKKATLNGIGKGLTVFTMCIFPFFYSFTPVSEIQVLMTF